jgi:cell division transport system permease protein
MGKISFFFREAFGSLRRNYFMTIAALVTVLLSMAVLGVVLVFASTINGMLKDLNSKVEITVYLKDSASPTAVDAMQAQIVGWTEVKTSNYVSKDAALARLREEFKDHPEILDTLQYNPLPASFEISLKDPKKVDVVAARFSGNPIVDEVSYGKELAQRIFRVTSTIRNVMLVFLVLLGLVSILLISNTIRLSIFARRREVEIMKLVGATNWFIRWPFMIEGGTVGLLGAGLALAVVLVGTTVVFDRIRQSLVFMSVPFNLISPWQLAGLLLLTGVVIGALGSGLGLRRFLKV